LINGEETKSHGRSNQPQKSRALGHANIRSLPISDRQRLVDRSVQLGERLRQYRCPLQLRFFASGGMLGKKELKLLRAVDGSGGKHE
jgi:hypothetical protein